MRPSTRFVIERLRCRWSRLLHGDSGQGLVEYALIIAVVSLGALVSLGFMSGKIQALFSKSGNSVGAVGQHGVGNGGQPPTGTAQTCNGNPPTCTPGADPGPLGFLDTFVYIGPGLAAGAGNSPDGLEGVYVLNLVASPTSFNFGGWIWPADGVNCQWIYGIWTYNGKTYSSACIVPPSPPANTSKPTITQNGTTLNGDHGTWTSTTNITYAGAWFKDGAPLTGHGGQATCNFAGDACDVTRVAGDLGHSFTLEATATNVTGSTTATSDPFTPVTPPAPPPPAIAQGAIGNANDPTNSTTASFTFSDSQAGVTFQCERDGGAYGTCTILGQPAVIYTGLAGGSHTVNARVVDGLGQTSGVTSYTWTIDRTAPTLAAGGASPTSPTHATTMTFTITGNENIDCTSISSNDFTITRGTYVSVSGTAPTNVCTVTINSTAAVGQTTTVDRRFSFGVTDTVGNNQTAVSGLPINWTRN